MPTMKTIISIDPGQTGAIVVRYQDGKISAYSMPETIGDLWDTFCEDFDDPECIMENVGGYVPGNSGPGAVKFAKHIGQLEMALYAAGIPTTKVAPAVWMRAIRVPKLEKKYRKHWIKDAMQRLYPTIKVTLVNADALGILTYYLSRFNHR